MKGLFKRLSVLTASLAMVFGVGLVNNEKKNAKAEATIYKQTIFSKENNSAGNSSYTGTFDNTTNGFTVKVANGNNNQNNWSGHVRFGQKKAASKGTIITNEAIDKKITRIDLAIGAKCTSVNAINVYADANATPTTLIGSFADYGTNKTISLDVSAKTATDLFYKIEFDMAAGANGNLDIGQVDFYVDDSISEDTPLISINEGAQKIQPSESVTFTTTIKNVDPSPTVTWSTDTNDYGTIDQDGKFTATAEGVVTVTATMTVNGTDYSASVKVTIKTKVEPVISEVAISDLMTKTTADNTVIKVKGKVANLANTTYGNFDLVDVNDSTKKIYVYGATADTTKLTLTDSENGYYTGTWQSGPNFNKACVADDIITMHAVLTVYKNAPQIQGVIVEVEKPAEAITLSDTSVIMKNGTGKTLTATLTGLTGSVTWASSNTDVADVADGVITTKAAGNTTITATLGSVTASCYVGVTDNLGSVEEPFNVSDAIYAAIAGNGLTSTEKYYIKGIIAAYTPNSSDVSTYGNISFDISDDGTTTKVFKAFQVNYLNGDKFTSADQVAEGDTVVLYGAVMNYNNATPETEAKGVAYVYAHTPKVTRTLKSLSLSGSLVKTEYTTDDTFSPEGLTITANYSDETTEDVTNDVTWPALTAGMTSITGTYEDKTIEVTGITVTEAVVTYTLTIKQDVETIYADTDGKLTYELKDNKGNAFSGNITSVAWSSSNTTVLEIGQTSGEYLAYESGKTTIELCVYTDNTSVYFNTTLELEVKNAPTYVVDKLTASDFTATSTGYTDFKDVASTSGIKYAGNSAKNGSNIQLKSKNSNSGIVSTTAKRILTKVEAEWSSTATGTLDVYGYNTAFNDATELYNTKAVKLGSLTSASPSLEIPTDAKYAYVGVRSNKGAVIIASISFTWDVSKDANDFIDMWNKMRADGTNGICDYLNGTQDSSELDTLLEMYNTMLDDADKAIVNDAADGENNTIGNSILYIAAYKAAHTSNNSGMNNAYRAVTNNISFILIISVIGLSSVLGYYFIQKRRLAK